MCFSEVKLNKSRVMYITQRNANSAAEKSSLHSNPLDSHFFEVLNGMKRNASLSKALSKRRTAKLFVSCSLELPVQTFSHS